MYIEVLFLSIATVSPTELYATVSDLQTLPLCRFESVQLSWIEPGKSVSAPFSIAKVLDWPFLSSTSTQCVL